MPKGKTIRLQENPATGEWKITMTFAVPGEFVGGILARALAQPPAAGSAAVSSPQTTVRLLNAGPNKIRAVKAVRDATGFGPKQAFDFVNSAPRQYSCRDRLAAACFLVTLNKCGATAVLE